MTAMTFTEFNKTLSDNILPKNISEILEPFELELDNQTFHPHVSLGRIKDAGRNIDIIEILKMMKLNSMKQDVYGMTLFENTLHPTGASYKVVEEFEFN